MDSNEFQVKRRGLDRNRRVSCLNNKFFNSLRGRRRGKKREQREGETVEVEREIVLVFLDSRSSSGPTEEALPSDRKQLKQ